MPDPLGPATKQQRDTLLALAARWGRPATVRENLTYGEADDAIRAMRQFEKLDRKPKPPAEDPKLQPHKTLLDWHPFKGRGARNHGARLG